MLLKSDFLKLILFAFFFSVAPSLANANSESICTTRPNEKVQQIYIFDGKPEELAYLAPDDNQTNSNIYTLNYIYDAGRFVTIRCKYDSNFIYDVEMKDKVNQCKFSKNKSDSYILICK